MMLIGPHRYEFVLFNYEGQNHPWHLHGFHVHIIVRRRQLQSPPPCLLGSATPPDFWGTINRTIF